MPLSVPHEALVRQVNSDRAEVEAAELGLEAARSRLTTHHSDSQEAVFYDLANAEGLIEGERIVDFVEASMRLAGESRIGASGDAEKLVPIFTPKAGGEPVAAYFRAEHRGYAKGFVTVTNPDQRSQSSGARFQLGLSPKYGQAFFLRATTDQGASIFKEQRMSLGVSGVDSTEWLTALQTDDLLFDFGEAVLINNPHVKPNHKEESPKIFIGSSVEAEIVKQYRHNNAWGTIYSAEAVALLGLVRRASGGGAPVHPFVDDIYHSDYRNASHRDRTLRKVQSYVTTLLNGSREASSADGLPVLFHASQLHRQKINRHDLHEAAARGMVEVPLLTMDHVTEINRRLALKSNRRIGEVLDQALETRAEVTATTMAELKKLGGFSLSAEALIKMVDANPALLKRGSRPDQYARKSDAIAAGAASDSVGAFFQLSPRFKEARRDHSFLGGF